MRSFVMEAWDDEGAKTTFYTVRKLGINPEDDSTRTETDKFFDKFEGEQAYADALNKLVLLIVEVIGNEHGAIPLFFSRRYNDLHELPPKPRVAHFELGLDWKEFPLRLFCLWINEELVVLFNGGLKTSQRTQDSPDLSMKAREAEDFARRIERALDDDLILIEGRTIVSWDGEEPIVID